MLLTRKSGCKGTNKITNKQVIMKIFSIFASEMSKITELSILIPNYNTVCLPLVQQLQALLQATLIPYEILVGDDGSDNKETIASNLPISSLSNCQYILREQNVGRAVIRNFLAQKAQYSFLLFIDSDMTVLNNQFITRYLKCPCLGVICGGVSIHSDEECLKDRSVSSRLQGKNLRYLYEKAEEDKHIASQRQASPYQHLHTANLLIRREVMLQHPFDERFRHYGYEDVLLGKTLRQHRIPITHIDNPLGFCTFETNADFVSKTEEGLRTLYTFQSELKGYSRLLTLVSGIHIPLILSIIRLGHRLFHRIERRNLCGPHPSLLIFKLYRLGYFLSLH